MKYFKHPSITYAAYKYVPSIIAGLIIGDDLAKLDYTNLPKSCYDGVELVPAL